MKRCSLRFSLILGLATPAAVIWTNTAQADNPSWAEQQVRNQELQRQALQQQAQQGISPQAQQFERWKQEWIQQHPNEPIPTMGALEKLHRGELMTNMNTGFARMRQARQAQLQQNRQMARQNQERTLAAQHITWSPQQWANWDKEYDLQMQQRANEYLEAVRQSGEMAREEAADQQRHKDLGY